MTKQDILMYYKKQKIHYNNTMMKKRNIIIDTDPGGDDALALAMVLQNPEINILGITTTYGNVPLKKTTVNALRILNYFNRLDIPVIQGADKPFKGTAMTAEDFHGQDGMGDTTLPSPNDKPLKINAIDFLYKSIMANKNNITIIALGPLTNLATLFIKFPDVMQYINSLVIMGGTLDIPAVTRYGEFNFFNDPLAQSIVLKSSVKKFLASLDVTNKVFLNEKEIVKYKNTRTRGGRFLYDTSRFWKKNLSENEPFILWDPVGIGQFLAPELFTFEQVDITVETEDKKNICKMTLMPSKSNTSTFLARDIQVEKFLQLFKKLICV